MRNKCLFAAATIALLFSAIALGACGGSDDSEESDSSAESADGAFIAEMTEHHTSAIEMAEIASERGEHLEVQELARNIIASQGGEIAQMERIHERLFDMRVGSVEHGTLGLSEEAMGMDHDVAALESAKPFDREFIDMMIPHHQGAIRMARLELADGEDGELVALASAIIEEQATEIEEMNSWRLKWYGSESPAGGVPVEGEPAPPSSQEHEADSGSEEPSTDSMEGMEH